MALTSASTLANAYAQANDNLDYLGIPAKTRLFLEAIRFIKVNRPSIMAGDASSQLSFPDIDTDIERAEEHLRAIDFTTRARFIRGF